MSKITLHTGEILHLREAEAADAKEMILHAQQVGDETDFLTFTGSQFQKTEEEEIEIILDHKKADNQIFLLAILDGELVGMGNVVASHKPRMRHFGTLGLSIIKTQWGKRIGQHIIEYFIEWAKSSDVITKLNLDVQYNNARAIRLYERLGFEVEGHIRRGTFTKGKYYDLVVMGMMIDGKEGVMNDE